jgi:hypothetical protein
LARSDTSPSYAYRRAARFFYEAAEAVGHLDALDRGAAVDEERRRSYHDRQRSRARDGHVEALTVEDEAHAAWRVVGARGSGRKKDDVGLASLEFVDGTDLDLFEAGIGEDALIRFLMLPIFMRYAPGALGRRCGDP